MSVKVKKIALPRAKRIIAVSDIHGNIDCFNRLMKKVGYTDEDVLIIVGDFLEKGPKNLETLRTMMELDKKDNVHILCGNCEIIWEFVKDSSLDSWFLPYCLSRKSLLEEMCGELNIPVGIKTELSFLKQQLSSGYKEALQWLEDLPVILETEDFLFVHAGLTSENLSEQTFFHCVKTDAFMNCGLSFQRYVVVGHWPTNNYGTDKTAFNPIMNSRQRIISIDGGNIIKNCGQLNALILRPEGMPAAPEKTLLNDARGYSFDYCDELPTGFAMHDQQESSRSINISWMNNQIELLEEGEEFSNCLHVPTAYKLMIPNNYIYETGGKHYCYDSTDYMLGVSRGDKVSVVERWSDRYLAKKDGVVGWILGRPG